MTNFLCIFRGYILVLGTLHILLKSNLRWLCCQISNNLPDLHFRVVFALIVCASIYCFTILCQQISFQSCRNRLASDISSLCKKPMIQPIQANAYTLIERAIYLFIIAFFVWLEMVHKNSHTKRNFRLKSNRVDSLFCFQPQYGLIKNTDYYTCVWVCVFMFICFFCLIKLQTKSESFFKLFASIHCGLPTCWPWQNIIERDTEPIEEGKN